MGRLSISLYKKNILGCSEIEKNMKSSSKYEYMTSLTARPTSGFFVSFFPLNQMIIWYGEECSYIFILLGQKKLLSTVPDSEFMQKLLSLPKKKASFMFFCFYFKTCIFKVHLLVFSLSASFTVRNMKHSMFTVIWQWFSPKTVSWFLNFTVNGRCCNCSSPEFCSQSGNIWLYQSIIILFYHYICCLWLYAL